VPGACIAAAPIAYVTEAPQRAALDACEPKALNATSGLTEAGARITAEAGTPVDAAAPVEARHIVTAPATLAHFIEEQDIT